jgi:hypothetical protein
MASDREKDRTELRKEIKIAIFWRKLIGDFEYIKFNPDDMLRWYLALDMRGEDEIRDLMNDRYNFSARRTPVLGLVGEKPHPPAWIVREWLETRQPKFPIWRIFGASCGFVVIVGLLMPTMRGCQAMQSLPPQVFIPPASRPSTQLPPTSLYSVQVPSATQPIPVQPMSTVITPVPGILTMGQSPPVSQPQMGVPLSAGRAPSTGNTGAANIGISGPAPSANNTTGTSGSRAGGGAPP